MSQDTEKNFEYTKASYWKGSQIDPTLLKAVTVFGGFFGLDHFLLRSPKTGILKAIVNFLTLGFWYFYDIIQVFRDLPFIREFGYTLPGYGPSGIGAGMVYSEGGQPTAPEGVPNPLYFMAYAALIAIPFGFSHFIAGDYYGGAAKFILSISPFTFLFGWLWGLYSTYNMTFNTESLFKEGTDRIFPVSNILGAHGPAPNLINPNIEKQIPGLAGYMTSIFGFIAPFLGPFKQMFFEKVSDVGEKGIEITGAPQQTGGSLEGTSSISQIVFLGTALSILLGAVGLTVVRYLKASKTTERDRNIPNDLPPEVTDVPPSGPVAL